MFTIQLTNSSFGFLSNKTINLQKFKTKGLNGVRQK